MQSRFDNRLDLSPADLGNPARARRIFFQARQSKGQKPLSPQLDSWTGSSQPASNLLAGYPLRRHLNDSGPLHQTQRKTSCLRPRIQSGLLFGSQSNGFYG